MSLSKLEMRGKRKRRIRKKISGTPECPRLSIYKSLKYVYAQIVDDISGKTLAFAHSMESKKGGSNKQAASQVGALIAQKAKSLNIQKVAFDRNGYLYHGVVQSLAEAARKEGLKF